MLETSYSYQHLPLRQKLHGQHLIIQFFRWIHQQVLLRLLGREQQLYMQQECGMNYIQFMDFLISLFIK